MKSKQKTAKVLSTYELMQIFPNEQTAIDYLAPIFWPDGPVCPYCEGRRITARTTANYYRCNDCLKTFTIRVGTLFERSHIPLHKWLYAMYLIVTARKGISSLQLSKELGITQKSAWFLLQRIRAACGNQTKKILSGIVEIDKIYLGGLESNKHEYKKLNAGRGPVGKTAVMGMRDRKGSVVAKVMPAINLQTVEPVIKNKVAIISTICTDEHSAYRDLHVDYAHKTVKHSAKQYVDGMAHTNGIESVWAVLKRGFYGTYHSFSKKHTNLYVDEFMFWLNEGNCRIDTVDRLAALLRGMKGQRLTYWNLTKNRCYSA